MINGCRLVSEIVISPLFIWSINGWGIALAMFHARFCAYLQVMALIIFFAYRHRGRLIETME
jgi:hypothetical protein